jgi:hypothetical protein
VKSQEDRIFLDIGNNVGKRTNPAHFCQTDSISSSTKAPRILKARCAVTEYSDLEETNSVDYLTSQRSD